VQANIRAALAPDEVQGEVYNVAVGDRTSLLDLFQLLHDGLAQHQIHYHRDPEMGPFRRGDVRDTQASIEKAERLLGYAPTHNLGQGLKDALPWYIDFFSDARDPAQASPAAQPLRQ
jgi:UDP-N-acetylglucosamine 4-epimerase